ncbi:MAG: pilus assembly protein PilM [Eubacteriales bacterium]|nr:pilus assembly protein PilM [Eubacteriales bacterium]
MKKCLGIELGNLTAKLALCTENKIIKFVHEHIPEGCMRDGQVDDWEQLTEFMKDVCLQYRLKGSRAAFVLPEGQTYVSRLTMPDMTPKQMRINLPYEFEDLVMRDSNYLYDYAILGRREEEGKRLLDLLAAAIDVELVAQYEKLAADCGLKMVGSMPETAVYQNMMRKYFENNLEEMDQDFVMLNLGYDSCQMRIFVGGKYEVIKQIDTGLRVLAEAIADSMGISAKEAGTYIDDNRLDILRTEACHMVYDRMTVEIMRGINFFSYSYGQSSLSAIYCCGRGAGVEPLLETIENAAATKVRGIYELFEGMYESKNPFIYGSAAIGVTWD